MKNKQELAEMYDNAYNTLKEVVGYRISFGNALHELEKKYPELEEEYKKIAKDNFENARWDFMDYLSEQYRKNTVYLYKKRNRLNVYGTKLINLTDQNIDLLGEDGKVLTIEAASSDEVCRKIERQEYDFMIGMLEVTKISIDAVINIPGKLDNTYYIVSPDIAQYLKKELRSDILTINENSKLIRLNR